VGETFCSRSPHVKGGREKEKKTQNKGTEEEKKKSIFRNKPGKGKTDGDLKFTLEWDLPL